MPAPRPYLYMRRVLDGNERRYVDQCLESSWISSRGEFVERFEREFAGFIGAAQATTVANGTVALHLAMVALGIGPGDEVIVPTLTYIASVNTIAQTGATPVFADSLATTWQVDPEAIRQAITPRTRAVMVVHLYGHPCDMSPISALCAERGLLLDRGLRRSLRLPLPRAARRHVRRRRDVQLLRQQDDHHGRGRDGGLPRRRHCISVAQS